MPEKSIPALPKLLVHQPIDIMKMNCLERFQPLIGSVEKARPLFDRERADIFQAYPPDAFQFGVLHERFGHIAQGRCCGVLSGEFRHAGTPMHLHREV